MSKNFNSKLFISPKWIGRQLQIDVTQLENLDAEGFRDSLNLLAVDDVGRLYKYEGILYVLDTDGRFKNVYTDEKGEPNISYKTGITDKDFTQLNSRIDTIKGILAREDSQRSEKESKRPEKKLGEESDDNKFNFFDDDNPDPDDDDNPDDDEDGDKDDDDDFDPEPNDFDDKEDDDKKDELNVVDIAGIDRKDVNGFYERDLAGGEYLKRTKRNVVHFPPNFHGVASGQQLETLFLTTQDIRRIVTLNACMLWDSGISIENSLKIAFIRCLLIERGLISDLWSPKDYSVRYIEAKYHEDNSSYATILPPFIKALGSTVLEDSIKEDIIYHFNSCVCLMAFIFRSRGHHYKPEFLQAMNRIGKSCEMPINKMFLKFELLFTIALHCIPPRVLDQYWEWSVVNGKCTGALVKRFDCSAAGSASIFAIYTGLSDVTTLLPQLKTRYRTDYEYLENTIAYLKSHRWEGSINHTYYGVARFRYDENRFNGLVALVLGALDQFAPDAPLGKAPSLKRVGNNAPITAAIIGTVLSNIVKSDKYAQSYLLEGTNDKT